MLMNLNLIVDFLYMSRIFKEPSFCWFVTDSGLIRAVQRNHSFHNTYAKTRLPLHERNDELEVSIFSFRKLTALNFELHLSERGRPSKNLLKKKKEKSGWSLLR